jgi:hypothetical protein
MSALPIFLKKVAKMLKITIDNILNTPHLHTPRPRGAATPLKRGIRFDLKRLSK